MGSMVIACRGKSFELWTVLSPNRTWCVDTTLRTVNQTLWIQKLKTSKLDNPPRRTPAFELVFSVLLFCRNSLAPEQLSSWIFCHFEHQLDVGNGQERKERVILISILSDIEWYWRPLEWYFARWAWSCRLVSSVALLKIEQLKIWAAEIWAAEMLGQSCNLKIEHTNGAPPPPQDLEQRLQASGVHISACSDVKTAPVWISLIPSRF